MLLNRLGKGGVVWLSARLVCGCTKHSNSLIAGARHSHATRTPSVRAPRKPLFALPSKSSGKETAIKRPKNLSLPSGNMLELNSLALTDTLHVSATSSAIHSSQPVESFLMQGATSAGHQFPTSGWVHPCAHGEHSVRDPEPQVRGMQGAT
jgi:hypothetical protein